MEIGGNLGPALTERVQDAVQSFNEVLDQFKAAKYGLFDIEADQFEADHKKFWQQTTDLEHRVATLIRQALDDCHTDEAAFKLLDSFESVLTRSIVQAELEPRLIQLLNDYAKELQRVQKTFRLEAHSPPIYNNMPPIAGALNWTCGIMSRVSIPLQHFKNLGPVITEADEMANVTYPARLPAALV